MTQKRIVMERREKIALVAHDNKKLDLVEWAKYNRDHLEKVTWSTLPLNPKPPC